MRTRFFTLRWKNIAAIAVTMLSAACHKNHDKIAGPDIVADPKGGKDTITVGNTLRLSPSVSAPGTTTFAWTLDGNQVSTDSAYPFSPADRGDFTITVSVSNAGGTATQDYKIHVYGKYEHGFFTANEGWYGHGSGTLNFYRYDTKLMEDSVFEKENPGKDLGPNTTTLEFGTVYNNKVYLSTKIGGPLVQADAYSLKETGRIATASGNDFRALLPIDTTLALLGTGDGIVRLNLQTMTAGASIAGISGETGDMLLAGSHIFVLTANDGLDILNSSDYSIAKTIPGITVGLVKAMDGSVWAAGGDSVLVKIDPSSLDTSNVHVPFEINGTFGFWHPGSMAASTKENAVYIAYNGAYSGATSIYKYVIGNEASLSQGFINIDAGKELYGQGVSYNPATDQIAATTVESGYGTHYSVNALSFYSTTDGSLQSSVEYDGYYFPALLFYH